KRFNVGAEEIAFCFENHSVIPAPLYSDLRTASLYNFADRVGNGAIIYSDIRHQLPKEKIVHQEFCLLRLRSGSSFVSFQYVARIKAQSTFSKSLRSSKKSVNSMSACPSVKTHPRPASATAST